MKSIISNPPSGIFFSNKYEQFTPSNIHQHGHCEILVVGNGCIEVTVDNKKIQVKANQAILIPDRAFHSTDSTITPTLFFGFQLEHHCTEASVISLPESFAQDFFEKLKTGISENKESLYINRIMFIASELIQYNKAENNPKDYKYIINEFFSLNYNKNITVADMAKELSLSTAQTQRVIKKYTGKTFGENLLTQRMLIARNLTKTMSMEKIAAYVGYQSYSGFWKAYKKYTGKA